MLRNSVYSIMLAVITLTSWVAHTAQAEAPPQLETAVRKWIADENHWAFTQTIRRTDINEGETVERFDPSKPDDQQWSLLKLHGQEPTEEQLKKWRGRKLREMRKREENSLGDLLDLENARLDHECAEFATYEVPLRPVEDSRWPPEKFRVLIDIDKRLSAIEHLKVSLRSSFRMKGIASVNSVAVTCDLRVIDEKYAPQPTCIIASGTGRILGLFKVAQGGEIRWADYRRVKPYNDRFDVKLGDIKALGF